MEHHASAGASVYQGADLNGLPKFLNGTNKPILDLFGYTSRALRNEFINDLKRSAQGQMLMGKLPKSAHDFMLPAIYSSQMFRFIGFWRSVAEAARTQKRSIELERKKYVPDLLTFLLASYASDYFELVLDDTCLADLDLKAIEEGTKSAIDEFGAEESWQPSTDLRFLMLWPRIIGDLEKMDSIGEQDQRKVLGAVFALASAYNCPEIIDLAIRKAPQVCQTAFATLKRYRSEPAASPNAKTWTQLVGELTALAGRFTDAVSSALLDEVEALLGSMRELASGNQEIEIWIQQVFDDIKKRVASTEGLAWLSSEMDSLPQGWRDSGLLLDQIKPALEAKVAVFNTDLDQYLEASSNVASLSAAITEMGVRIAAAPIGDRRQLRLEEKVCRDRLNVLSDRISELELALVPGLVCDIGQKPIVESPKPEPPKPEPPKPEPPKPEPPKPEPPKPEPSTPEPPKPEPPKPEPLKPEPPKPEPPKPEPPKPEPPKPEPPKPITDTRAPKKRSETELLLVLSDEGAKLTRDDLSNLGHLQRGWLEIRQPLRAWLLALSVERKQAPLGDDATSLVLPSWACRLLSMISDPKLPLSDDEIARTTEFLYQVRTLEAEQKELVVLWLTAELFCSTSDRALRIARLVSPQQFDLPPHSLGQYCSERLLVPVFNGGSLTPPKDNAELQRGFANAIERAKEVINPTRNNYQNNRIRVFWRNLIVTGGSMGKLLSEAAEGRFSAKALSAEDLTVSLPEWSDIVASYRHNMQNRMEEFVACIEEARAAYASMQEASKATQASISRTVVQEVLAGVQRQGYEAWWLDRIGSGLTEL